MVYTYSDEELGVSKNVLVWRRIREMTNIRPQNFRACLSYVVDFADNKMAAQFNCIIKWNRDRELPFYIFSTLKRGNVFLNRDISL